MRGSGEPESSLDRVKELEQFLRQCNAFDTDQGGLSDGDGEQTLYNLRQRLEEILTDP